MCVRACVWVCVRLRERICACVYHYLQRTFHTRKGSSYAAFDAAIIKVQP